MTIEQTVDIPVDRRLTIDVPHEIPAGRTILAFTPVTAQKADVVPVCENNIRAAAGTLKIEAERNVDPDRKPISRYFGILSPDTYGNGVAYQRKLRDEWGE